MANGALKYLLLISLIVMFGCATKRSDRAVVIEKEIMKKDTCIFSIDIDGEITTVKAPCYIWRKGKVLK